MPLSPERLNDIREIIRIVNDPEIPRAERAVQLVAAVTNYIQKYRNELHAGFFGTLFYAGASIAHKKMPTSENINEELVRYLTDLATKERPTEADYQYLAGKLGIGSADALKIPGLHLSGPKMFDVPPKSNHRPDEEDHGPGGSSGGPSCGTRTS